MVKISQTFKFTTILYLQIKKHKNLQFVTKKIILRFCLKHMSKSCCLYIATRVDIWKVL